VFEASRKQGGPDAVWYAPGKASNAGGVAVSGLEMAQNSQRLSWTPTEVDQKLKGIMTNCYKVCRSPNLPHTELQLYSGCTDLL
jgi:glutamate dehydrogenase (NADP+)